MSVALHGHLQDFGIAEVFQLIGQQRKTGTLEVVAEDLSTFITFDRGRVVRGGEARSRTDREPLGSQLVRAGYLTREQLTNLERESERSARPISDLILSAGLIEPEILADVQHLLTKETVFSVMRRHSGDFHFTAEPIRHGIQPERLLGAEQILMDGLRMLDEWETFASIIPDESLIFRRVGSLESARALTMGDSNQRLGNAERVLQLVDGRLSVRRIIDLSRLGTFEATRTLAELRQAGVIDEAAPGQKNAGPRPFSGSRKPILQFLRAALATATPFLILGLLAGAALDRVGTTHGLSGALIPEPAVARIGARHETRLLRNLVEAYFYENGRYPATLGDIAQDLEQSGHALSASELAGYYYVPHQDEVVLLPPMR